MTRTVARMVMVSHITSILMKYFTASQTTRTRLFNQCRRVAAIIQSSDLSGDQSNFIHSRRTRDACEAAGLVTRVVASLTNQILDMNFYMKEHTKHLCFKSRLLTFSTLYNYSMCLEILEILQCKLPACLYEFFNVSLRSTEDL